jgi:hypothetical protein
MTGNISINGFSNLGASNSSINSTNKV